MRGLAYTEGTYTEWLHIWRGHTHEGDMHMKVHAHGMYTHKDGGDIHKEGTYKGDMGCSMQRNHPHHTSTHEVCIRLDHISTGVPRRWGSESSRHGCFIAARYLSSHHGCIKYMYVHTRTPVISARVVSRRKVAMPAIPLLLFPHHLRYPSHSNITFSRIFPAFEHYFFPRPPSLVYQTKPPSAWDAIR